MTVLTDIPQSGLYFQRGSVIQIVVQLIDNNTGNPIPLQSATDLTIILVYPDNQSVRSFPASLYTDGADGRISYTTVNDGEGYSDLNQIGLYRIQGYCTIGNAPLPPSSATDFYILPNVSDNLTPGTYPILSSVPSGIPFQIYILPTGNLDTIQMPLGTPAQPSIYMQDYQGNIWEITVLDKGQMVTTVVEGPFPAVQQIYVVDSQRKQWVVTVVGPNLKTT